ncbi:MAG TPA: PIN domain-containing protein [Candidatus Saccharimonadales bacterium]|nr:PIN domain-containing protein [Candidatus Saccharimonadales bacterium]
MTYLLDTSFLIDYLRGDPGAVARFGALFDLGAMLLVNDVVVCELMTGSRRDPDPELEALLEPLDFVQPGPAAAALAGRWRHAAMQSGRTLSLADALIAATSFHNGATVLSRNARDFALTPVAVESY